jgi:hypothetical protein
MFPLNFLHQDAVDAEEHGLLRNASAGLTSTSHIFERVLSVHQCRPAQTIELLAMISRVLGM